MTSLKMLKKGIAKRVKYGLFLLRSPVPNWLTLRLNKIDLSTIPPATLLVFLCLIGLDRFRNKLTRPILDDPD